MSGIMPDVRQRIAKKSFKEKGKSEQINDITFRGSQNMGVKPRASILRVEMGM